MYNDELQTLHVNDTVDHSVDVDDKDLDDTDSSKNTTASQGDYDDLYDNYDIQINDNEINVEQTGNYYDHIDVTPILFFFVFLGVAAYLVVVHNRMKVHCMVHTWKAGL